MHGSLIAKWVSTLKVLYRAVRPFSLSASVVPVLVGTSLALSMGDIDFVLFLLTLFGSMLIQMGTNLSDEYSDHARGSYTSKFPAPHKVILLGLLSPRSVKLGAYLCFGTASIIGLYLVSVVGWPILLVGVASITVGYFYSSGPFPLGNLGLGEPLVFFFMGILAVMSTYYIQVGGLSWEALMFSMPVAFLVTAILVANNLRDMTEDREVGKKTTATLFGVRVAALAYCILVSGAFLFVVIALALGMRALFLLAPLLCLPWGISLIQRVWRAGEERYSLNIAVKGTAVFHLQFGLLMSAGLLAIKYLTGEVLPI